MKVVSWNLNHRGRELPIPDDLPALFTAMGADVVLLNEFVDGPTRTAFRNSLRSEGYRCQLVSRTPAKQNQVFAAARNVFSLGDIAPPTFGPWAASNFLHIKFEHTPIEFVGSRVPIHKNAADRNAYQAQLLEIMLLASSRAMVFAGDMNTNPFAIAGARNLPGVEFAGCGAFWVPNPKGEWSYVNTRGTYSNRLDHVLHTEPVSVGAATYVSNVNGRVLAGPVADGPISDHAALTFTVRMKSDPPDRG